MDIYDLLMFQDKNEGTTPNLTLVLRFFLEQICEEWNDITWHINSRPPEFCWRKIAPTPHKSLGRNVNGRQFWAPFG